MSGWYNGFSPQQRARGGNYYNKQKKAGLRNPTVCQACGQTGGVNGHSEDYSEPFGPHIGEYELCYTCHMMVHCRTRNPLAWKAYREAVEAGATFEANLTRNFRGFCASFLTHRPLPKPAAMREPPARRVLQEIEEGVALKRRKPVQGTLI